MFSYADFLYTVKQRLCGTKCIHTCGITKKEHGSAVKQESDIYDVIETLTRWSKRQSEILYKVMKAKYTSLVTSLVILCNMIYDMQYDIVIIVIM